jgi:hypothetical protein
MESLPGFGKQICHLEAGTQNHKPGQKSSLFVSKYGRDARPQDAEHTETR